MAQSLPRDPDSLREESRQPSGGRAARLRLALVQAATPTHDLRWFLKRTVNDSVVLLPLDGRLILRSAENALLRVP